MNTHRQTPTSGLRRLKPAAHQPTGRLLQVRLPKAWLPKVGLPKVGLSKVGLSKVRLSKVRLLQVRLPKAWLFAASVFAFAIVGCASSSGGGPNGSLSAPPGPTAAADGAPSATSESGLALGSVSPAATTPEPVTPVSTAQVVGSVPAVPPTEGSSGAGSSGTGSSEAVWSLVAVVDGDTLKVQGPVGRITVRVVGINSPESGECFAAEATAAMRQLLAGHALRLIIDVSDVDQYGRSLRFVETADGANVGTDVGAEMVRGGFALSRRYSPDTTRSDRYDQLQQQAQVGGVGLWAADACGPAGVPVSISISQHANAAGDDNTNLNDEWVRFTNQAATPVDLSRWIVADESASHRYVFGAFVLGAGASVTLHTGCGQDTSTDRFWCNTKSAVWNNSGDTVFLRDPNGNNVVVLSY